MSKFILGDCMDPETGIPSYPDNYFDLAIVDPPYGIGGDKGIQKNNGKFGFAKHKNTDWDKEIPKREYFLELMRVSKNQIIWGGNYFTHFLEPKMGWISWYKEQTDFSFSDFELAWTSFDTKSRQFNLLRGYDERGKHYSSTNGRIHPTQKPTALYRWLLANYAKPGDLILDTHVGSASSLIAFEQEGFEYVGYELDEDYYHAAKKRMEQVLAQTRLF